MDKNKNLESVEETLLQSEDLETITQLEPAEETEDLEAVTQLESAEEKEEELTQSEREELEQLRKERDKRNLKEKAYDGLYDNLHLSVRALDIFIGAMIILFFFVVIKGMGIF